MPLYKGGVVTVTSRYTQPHRMNSNKQYILPLYLGEGQQQQEEGLHLRFETCGRVQTNEAKSKCRRASPTKP